MARYKYKVGSYCVLGGAICRVDAIKPDGRYNPDLTLSLVHPSEKEAEEYDEDGELIEQKFPVTLVSGFVDDPERATREAQKEIDRLQRLIDRLGALTTKEGKKQ